MNMGAVRSARVAHLHREALRCRGAGQALEALNGAFNNCWRSAKPSPLLTQLPDEIARAAYRAIRPFARRSDRLLQRRLVAADTRLARANGWGSAGPHCPGSHGPKKPAAQALVCGDAAAPAKRDYLAGVTVQRPMVGVSDEP